MKVAALFFAKKKIDSSDIQENLKENILIVLVISFEPF